MAQYLASVVQNRLESVLPNPVAFAVPMWRLFGPIEEEYSLLLPHVLALYRFLLPENPNLRHPKLLSSQLHPNPNYLVAIKVDFCSLMNALIIPIVVIIAVFFFCFLFSLDFLAQTSHSF